MLVLNIPENEFVVVNGAVIRFHQRVSIVLGSLCRIVRGSQFEPMGNISTPMRNIYCAVIAAEAAPDRDSGVFILFFLF